MDRGIYRIRNLITEQIYIGSAAGRSGFQGRWANHRNHLRNNRHSNQKLQNSWNKYGESNFIFEIIEYTFKENCISREQYYIDTLKPHFNILPNASNRLGSKFSDKTIEKLKGRIPWNKGNRKSKPKKCPLVLAENLRKKQVWAKELGFKNRGRKRSPETVEKYSSKRRIPIIAKNLNTNEEIKFDGVGIAARALNLDTSMISKVCKGQYSYYKEWTFRYV